MGDREGSGADTEYRGDEEVAQVVCGARTGARWYAKVYVVYGTELCNGNGGAHVGCRGSLGMLDIDLQEVLDGYFAVEEVGVIKQARERTVLLNIKDRWDGLRKEMAAERTRVLDEKQAAERMRSAARERLAEEVAQRRVERSHRVAEEERLKRC